ncbi:MAG: Calx-beta domain-containing protein, partial [Cyanobacteriota bacterium]|nr:Calx-beta domain-containing protein [Cyanobacteriota bacterium]
MLNFNDYAIASYGGSKQDKNPTINLQGDGTTLQMVGNGWKKIAFPYTITPDTILEFDFKSTAPGEIHGIGFDRNNKIDDDRTFQLYGSQAWGLDDFQDYASSAGDWKSYRIPVGEFYTGEMRFLTFANDHDVANPTGESLFANVRVYEDSPTITPGSIEFDKSSYSVSEDGTTASITVTRTGGSDGAVSAEVSLTGGTAAVGDDFSEIFPLSVNFADGESGSKTVTIPIFDDALVETTETLALSLGNVTGGATVGTKNTTIVSIQDNDIPSFPASVLNFNDYAIQSYGGSQQDKNPTINIQGDGTALQMVGNGWKKIAFPYTITPDTVLEFDFKSTASGEIHGIGFDRNKKIDDDRTFQLYGSQAWGLDGFQDYASSAGDWKSYRIPVGEFYTGKMRFLTFTNDHDVANPTAESLFANIRVYEDIITIASGSIEFSSSTYSVSEDGTTASITVTRTGGSDGAVSAEVSLTGGTAAVGDDFSEIFPLSVNFADGESGSKTVTIPIFDDALVETTETLALSLSNVTGGATIGTQETAVLEIVDNDVAVPGTLAFGNPTYSINENGTVANITVTRAEGSDGAVSAEVNLTGGTATAGADFSNIFPISVNFADGESGSKTVTIPIVNDTSVEVTETLNLALANLVGGAILGSQGTAVLEIIDNDVAAPLSDPVNFHYGLDEQELLLSSFDNAGGWQLGSTQVLNGELLAKPGANWAEAHYDLSAFDNLDLDNGDISLYWRARADRSKPELAKFFVELNVLENPIVDGQVEDREVKWSIRPVAPNNGNFNNLPYLLYLDPGWQIPHEVEEELQVPNEFVTPNTYENFRLSLSKTGLDTVAVTPYHWANDTWQTFAAKSGSTLPMSLSIENNLAGRDFFESLTVRFRRDLSSLDAFAITQTSPPAIAQSPSPRLFLDTAKIDELKAAIEVEGSHHQATFQAIKARVDQNDWRVYDENPNDGNHNYARSWLAREAALMYLLTDDTSYAQIAYDTLYDVHNNPDPDNRLPESGYGLARAMVGMGFAIAYDWAKTGWTQQQQDYIRSQMTVALDAWPSYTHSNLNAPWGSNWVAVSRSAELVMMLAAEEEGNRTGRYDELKSQLQQHIEVAYGSTGWTQEGNGYLAYSGGFLLPAIYALQSVGDTSLD